MPLYWNIKMFSYLCFKCTNLGRMSVTCTCAFAATELFWQPILIIRWLPCKNLFVVYFMLPEVCYVLTTSLFHFSASTPSFPGTCGLIEQWRESSYTISPGLNIYFSTNSVYLLDRINYNEENLPRSSVYVCKSKHGEYLLLNFPDLIACHSIILSCSLHGN